MGVLPILQKNSNQRACLGNKNLPANYMSDYSVMGLVVGRLEAGLNKNRRMSKEGIAVYFNGHERSDATLRNAIFEILRFCGLLLP